jgi:hypothetical protein
MFWGLTIIDKNLQYQKLCSKENFRSDSKYQRIQDHISKIAISTSCSGTHL